MYQQEQQTKARERVEAREREETQAREDLVRILSQVQWNNWNSKVGGGVQFSWIVWVPLTICPIQIMKHNLYS